MADAPFTSAVVRPAEARDVVAIAKLIQLVWEDCANDFQCLDGESRLMACHLPSFIDDPENVTLVHESMDFGTAAVDLSGVIFLTRIAPTVYDLGIVATPQGSGVGTRLLDAAISYSRSDRTITEIYLDVFVRNPAIHLYERKGFQEYDRVRSTNQRSEELELCRMRLFIREFSATLTTAAATEAISTISKVATTSFTVRLGDSNKSHRSSWLSAILLSFKRGFSVIRKFAAFK